MDNKRLQGIMVSRLDRFSKAWDDIVRALAAMTPEEREQALQFAAGEDTYKLLIESWRREAEALS